MESRPCIYFQKGQCNRADCKFAHVLTPCHFFQQGNCRKGEQCRFAHVGSVAGAASASGGRGKQGASKKAADRAMEEMEKEASFRKLQGNIASFMGALKIAEHDDEEINQALLSNPTLVGPIYKDVESALKSFLTPNVPGIVNFNSTNLATLSINSGICDFFSKFIVAFREF